MTDLFGAPMTDADFGPTPKTLLRKALGKYHYRKALDRLVCCGTCAKHEVWEGNTRNYHKCALVGHSSSPATDIRVGNVCDAWEAK